MRPPLPRITAWPLTVKVPLLVAGLVVAVAFVVFLWGAFEFVRNAGDAKKREEGRTALLWGLVGLVVIFGAYGLVNIALGTFGVENIQKTLPH